MLLMYNVFILKMCVSLKDVLNQVILYRSVVKLDQGVNKGLLKRFFWSVANTTHCVSP